MGRSDKFDYQAAIENSLRANPDGLSLDELVERSGLKVDRSTMFRHLTHLLESGRVERVGKARASRYRPLTAARIAPDPAPPDGQSPGIRPIPEFHQSHTPNQAPSAVPRLPSAAHQLHQSGRGEPESVPPQALEHDAVVKKAVRTIVRDWKRFNRVNLQIYLSLLAKPEHLDTLAVAVETELAGLQEDNLDKFGLTPADFSRFTPPVSASAS